MFVFVLQALLFSSEDFGRDVPGVEALLRKHDDLERDLTVIEDKMEALENEAHRLVKSQPDMVRVVQAKQTEIIENWERLNDLFDERYVETKLIKVFRIRRLFSSCVLAWRRENNYLSFSFERQRVDVYTACDS